jgi:hypothetical protein
MMLMGLITLFAVNGQQWSWTGFAGSTSLWNWLRLLVQPIALAFLTVRLLMGAPLRLERAVCGIGVLLLAVLIVAGYSAHWSWTGFPGKQLWDWLSLMLFPTVAVLLPEWIRRGEPFGSRVRAGAGLALVAFVVVVIGSYHWGWKWTGFTGNTFRDWLDLMIAPFLLPVALKVVHTLHGALRFAADLGSLPAEQAGGRHARADGPPEQHEQGFEPGGAPEERGVKRAPSGAGRQHLGDVGDQLRVDLLEGDVKAREERQRVEEQRLDGARHLGA